jgi:ATP-dependent RNA helicase SUPV3L1/SUV3
MADITTPASPYGQTAGRSVIAVLGPTNTGKTHLAIERMLGHESGLIGLPLRLLAREVYDKIVARVGPAKVALITGEERIKPDNPRYWVSTVEAMPRELDVDFLAVDEIQLAADPERGHVFTERLFGARGRSETLLLGASTMQDAIKDLLPGTNFVTRHRFSKLTYAGQKKITRLPRRSAIVAFSAAEVYQIAELVRRMRGGAAVVIGALSPRTRNAQVELYQSGDVDFLVATDAIGMGLNLDVDHVAFAGSRKFDGRSHRELSPGELSQIAGRAGRHMNDGTFGVTGDVEPFSAELVNRLEAHEFEPVKILQWRNNNLDFASLDRLKESLRLAPPSPRLTRARAADDLLALELLGEDTQIREMARAPAALRMLWDACQIPDYRKIALSDHAQLIGTIYKYLLSDSGVIPEDWFAAQVDLANRTDGDIDTLSNRIAHIRTWTFVSNRQNWLADPEHWRQRTREIEDTLSDALHEILTQRFVDRRTSVLMKSMRDKDTLYADIENGGQIFVEKHFVGKLAGFRFTPDAAASGIHGKAARHAAAKVLASELAMRAERLNDSKDDAFQLTRTGKVLWEKQEIGQLEAGEDPLKPTFSLTADEHLSQPDKERILKRVQGWLNALIENRLKPLIDLSRSQEVTGLARGIAFRLVENFGMLARDTVANELKALDQQARAELRKFGVRFGAYNIYFPMLLKPAAADLLLMLWALKHGTAAGLDPATPPEPPRQGLTSVPVDATAPAAFYRAAGFQICGPRAVRIDMLERLADIIRPLTSWKPTEAQPEPPAGAVGRGGFRVQPEMMSIMGCSADELGHVLFSLGFRKERRPITPKPAVVVAEPAQIDADVAASAGTDGPAVAGDVPAGGDAHDGLADAQAAAVDAEIAIQEIAAGSGEPAPEPVPAETAVEAKAQPDVVAETSASAPAEAGTAEAVETSSADASSGAAEEAGAETAATADEPQFEEIWRPRRRQEEQRRPQHRRSDRREGQGQGAQQRDRGPRQGGDANRPAEQVASGDRPDQQQHQHRRHGRHGDQQRQGDQRQDNQRQGNQRQDSQRQDRRQGDQRQGDRQQREGRPHEGRGRDDRRREDHRKGGRPPHSGGPRVQSASPRPAKGGAANADSPFAALMQLKERLEGRTQDQA